MDNQTPAADEPPDNFRPAITMDFDHRTDCTVVIGHGLGNKVSFAITPRTSPETVARYFHDMRRMLWQGDVEAATRKQHPVVEAINRLNQRTR